MNTDFKWIKFLEIPQGKPTKTKTFLVFSKGSECRIGIVKWYSSFRKYSFLPGINTVYEEQCLSDIANFLKSLMLEHKALKQQEKQNNQ